MDEKARRHAAQEKAAQAARAKALAHLKMTGAKTQSEIVQPAAASRMARMRKMDNTMELVRKRKAAALAAQQHQQKTGKARRLNNAERSPVVFSMPVDKRSSRKPGATNATNKVRQSETPRLAQVSLPPAVWKEAATSGFAPQTRRGAAKKGFGVPRMLTTKEKSKLPKGWRVVVEAGLGRLYFWEPRTNRTSWRDPRTIQSFELTPAGQIPKPIDQEEQTVDEDSLARGVQCEDGREYFWNQRTGISAWSPDSVVLKPPPPPRIAGLEPEEDIGNQSMWEYLREKALRERRAKQDIAEGAAVEVAEKQDEEITEGHTNP